MNLQFDVAIVGGGLGGLAVAYHLSRQALATRRPLRCAIIEPRTVLGQGIAYSSSNPAHLLNVPASKMSLSDASPDDFLKWLQSNKHPFQAADFVPRYLYGNYLNSTLTRTLDETNGFFTLTHLREKVQSISRPNGQTFCLECGNAQSLRAAQVVVALGNDLTGTPAPAPLLSPWHAPSIEKASHTKRIAILGTGLTAIDTVLALEEKNSKAQYTLISRRGLLPLPHAASLPDAPEVQKALSEFLSIPSLGGKLRYFRANCQGFSEWRSLLDALRPHSHRIWSQLSHQEQLRFLRHLKPYWEVHRHRVPEQSLEKIKQLTLTKRLRVMKARVTFHADSIHPVKIYSSHTNQEIGLFDCAFDCRGLWNSLPSHKNPVLQSLIDAKLARYDSLGLGIIPYKDHTGAVTGELSPHLFTLGSLRRGELWETTALREIRQQAEVISKTILQRTSAQSEILAL